jgi:hypothetical protein
MRHLNSIFDNGLGAGLSFMRWCQSMQRNRFDRAAKDLLRASLEPDGIFESDAEVSPDTQRADGWFTPDPALPPTRTELGLLGRMTLGACTLEPFHATPGESDVSGCLRKLLSFRHILSLRKPAPELPRLWIISAGRPDGGIEGFAFRAAAGWPTGVYHAPRLLFAGLVVTSELPRGRDTLLLRLMGAGACLRDALAEFASLPVETRERAIAGPVLRRAYPGRAPVAARQSRGARLRWSGSTCIRTPSPARLGELASLWAARSALPG